MRHEEVPFGEREFWIARCKAGAEMIFPCLDSAFGGVAAVAVGRDALEVDVVFLEGFFEFVGAFVVDNVEGGSVAIGLEAFVQGRPRGCDFACLARL